MLHFLGSTQNLMKSFNYVCSHLHENVLTNIKYWCFCHEVEYPLLYMSTDYYIYFFVTSNSCYAFLVEFLSTAIL